MAIEQFVGFEAAMLCSASLCSASDWVVTLSGRAGVTLAERMNVHLGERLDLPARERWPAASAAVAAVLGVLVVVLLLAIVPMMILAHQFRWSDVGQTYLVMLPFATVGFLVARRLPRNPIGWILLGIVLALLAPGEAGQYALLHYRHGYESLPFARVAVFVAGGWIWLVFLTPLPIAFFPDGTLPSARWRWPVRAYAVLAVVVLGAFAWREATGVMAPDIRLDSSGGLATLGGSGSASVPAKIAGMLYVAILLAWVVGQVARFRRSSGQSRQQFKALLGGAAFSVACLIVALSLGGSSSAILRAAGGFVGLGVIALPLGIAVAILKYRLYEIDRLISRSLSYAILTALLVGIFLGLVALATNVFPFSSPVAVAASTLAAAALFNPLRLRVQHLVDRRFNRARYDADAILSAFTSRLQDAIDLDTVRNELVHAVDRSVQPFHASLWIRPPSSSRARS